MKPLTRDQKRALHAYRCVEKLPESQQADYKVLVHALGPNVMRSGMAAALTWLERDLGKRDAAGTLLGHLAAGEIPGLGGAEGKSLPAAVRELRVADYMLATRDLLRLSVWLKRAVQARLGGD